MKENITNRPDLEEASQAKVSESHYQPSDDQEFSPGAEPGQIDTTALPHGMREKIETVEISTLKPKR
jgi:hypothetical protein